MEPLIIRYFTSNAFQRTVSTRVIYYDDLEIIQSLGLDALQTLNNVGLHVIGNNDKRQQRHSNHDPTTSSSVARLNNNLVLRHILQMLAIRLLPYFTAASISSSRVIQPFSKAISSATAIGRP